MELVKLPAAGTPFWDYSQQLEAEHGGAAVVVHTACPTSATLPVVGLDAKT